MLESFLVAALSNIQSRLLLIVPVKLLDHAL
jgi:hypothetical protein